MSDLISRQEVYNMLHGLGGCDATDEWSKGWDKAIDTAISELDDIPTAYDVDKVVEQLERVVSIPTTGAEFINKQVTIEIVKGAVKE